MDGTPELGRLREEWRKAGYKRVLLLSERRDLVEELRSRGVRVMIATDLGAGIGTSMAVHLGVKPPLVVMKDTLYFFCPGLEVAVSSAVTAADAGAVPVDGEVVAVSGVEQGLDTAIVVKPAYSDEVFDPGRGLGIREVIYKPRSMMGPRRLLPW